ncbi:MULTISPECIES: hypothetical protein [unclassified Pseudomonas]|uniref:hypothetical protein n=1 Tax=unclassified Pseudomonas TaxID=196821 RepID=UPI000D34D4D5|nr:MULTISPECIES: hypothetical protein [unclassified Pseudomonas]RAU43421.1 hypothetical protein DBP26_019665 [Pseudomonas sp. RIT 409]RAU50042.1 hypothetical protein DBY65_023120 [Pseudomonas sp. RIT 412]
MRIFVGALAVALLAGCGTTPVSSTDASPVPEQRLLARQSAVKDGGTLVVTRDNGWTAGGGCYVALLLDGQVAARIGTGEVARLQVSPGRHLIGISGDSEGAGLCGLQIGQPTKETSLELKPGELQRYRISGDTNGLDLRPTSL